MVNRLQLSVNSRQIDVHLMVLVLHVRKLFMVTLWNRVDHYIFTLWFLLLLLLSFFFPCVISTIADWISAILPHMVWP